LVELRKPEAKRTGAPSLLARVKVPTTTPRLIPVPARPGVEPSADDPETIGAYVCAADVVRFFVHHLFPSMPVRHVYLFRVVRGATPLPGALPAGTQRPRREENRPAVRLDAEQRMDPELLRWLVEHLRLPGYAVARHDGLAEWACLPNLASAELPPRH
jgi:polyphosphate kinase